MLGLDKIKCGGEIEMVVSGGGGGGGSSIVLNPRQIATRKWPTPNLGDELELAWNWGEFWGVFAHDKIPLSWASTTTSYSF